MGDPYTKQVHPDGILRFVINILRGKTGARDAAGDTDAVMAL
jgi:hypothetical protein